MTKWFIVILFLINTFITVAYAANCVEIVGSTTTVLQSVKIADSPYVFGLGIGMLPPNSRKPWHIHTAPEMVYVLSGQVNVNVKDQTPEQYSAAQFFQEPINILHNIIIGPQGYGYVVVWGKRAGQSITINEEQSSHCIQQQIQRVPPNYSPNVLNIAGTYSHILQSAYIPNSPYMLSLQLSSLAANRISTSSESAYPQLFFVLSGSLSLLSNNKKAINYARGESFAISPHTAYSIRANKSGVKYLITSIKNSPNDLHPTR